MALFYPFPIIQTERLILRSLMPEDTKPLFEMRTDPIHQQFIDRPIPEKEREMEEFIQKIQHGIENDQWIYWAIQGPNESSLMGTICLWNWKKEQRTAEVGFELALRWQGNGYMQEALEAVIQYGFDQMQLTAIQAYTHALNIKSIQLLLKKQFKLKASIEEQSHKTGKLEQINIYERL